MSEKERKRENEREGAKGSDQPGSSWRAVHALPQPQQTDLARAGPQIVVAVSIQPQQTDLARAGPQIVVAVLPQQHQTHADAARKVTWNLVSLRGLRHAQVQVQHGQAAAQNGAVW